MRKRFDNDGQKFVFIMGCGVLLAGMVMLSVLVIWALTGKF